ncbi:MAG: serine/threonine-protein kinase [Cyanobacteria bacterium P01_G01_bin.54]
MQTLHSTGVVIGDRYTVQGKLGQGAVGTTYAALDTQSQQAVALKAISLSQAQDWKVVEMFEREAETLAQLSHPCIPQYLDHFYIDTPGDRHFYLVQERIFGQSLETLLRKGQWRPDEAQVKAIARKILDILDYLHTHTPPVIHRDIKPNNLIQREDGEIVLVDFGAVQEAFRHTLSRGGTFVGTVDYMPPEQFRGQATYASDLYSLGVTLIDLLTGPSTINDLPTKRLKFEFRNTVQVSPAFEDWLDCLIEPNVEDRFQSIPDARRALLQQGPSRPNPTRFIFWQIPQVGQLVLFLILITVITLTVVSVNEAVEANPEREIQSRIQEGNLRAMVPGDRPGDWVKLDGGN